MRLILGPVRAMLEREDPTPLEVLGGDINNRNSSLAVLFVHFQFSSHDV